MNAKPFLMIAALAITLMMVSCEGGTTFTKTVENNTSEYITVKLFANADSSDAVILKPKETKLVYTYVQKGMFTGKSYTCAQIIDSVHWEITNNKTLNKDIMIGDNWTRKSTGGRNAKEDCTFSISDSDLQ